MDLPDDSIGISDILDYRECPQRFAWSMRRHRPLPDHFQIFDGERDVPPEKDNWTNAYGSAIHDAIAVLEEDRSLTDEQAIDAIWPIWQHHLEPSDIDRMRADLETFHLRTQMGYRLIGAEIELRVPLMVYKGRQIYFRGRIDALYQHMQNDAIFLSRDYKSSKWARTEDEINGDLQQWAYNWAIHVFWPECRTLVQMYDQLRYGEVPVRKTEKQRAQIQSWLQKQVVAILEDERFSPKQNQWCQTCPLMPDCRVTHLSIDYWKNRIGALAPERKEGRKVVVQLTEDHAGFSIYTDLLPGAKQTHKVLERFIEAVEGVLKEMPDDEREAHGYGLTRPRSRDTYPADALRQAHERMGDDFFQVATLSKKGITDLYGEDSPEALEILALAQKKQGSASLKKLKK